MVSLGANAEDLVFDFSVAESVAAGFDASATLLEGQASGRASYESLALGQFRGYFSQLFASNMRCASADRVELASALRDVAKGVREIAQAAREENERRRVAREYVMKHDDWWEKAWDWFFGQEAPPRLEVNPAPVIQASAPPAVPRETPAVGSAGGPSMGVSSASVADLRSAASGLAGLDSSLADKPGELDRHLSDFAASCRFGSLDAGGVVGGLRAWLAENEQDVAWLRTVADAFDRFGSEGVVSAPNAALSESLQWAGVRATRVDLVVEPASISGIEPTTGYVVDPVNTATGNFVEQETDLVAGSVVFSRMYNSVGDHESWFGLGWFSVLDERLVFSDAGAVWLREDGRQTFFPCEEGVFGRAERANWWLDRVRVPFGYGVAVYALTDNAGNRRLFDEEGRVLGSDYDGQGRVVYGYDPAGRVESIVDWRGRGVRVFYDVDRVSALEASDGRRVDFSYDQGVLVAARGVLGAREYQWRDGLIVKVVSATGVVEAENGYDEAGRVVWQKTPAGRVVRFRYLPGRVTSSSDGDGSRADTWVSDEFGRLVKVVDSQGQAQTMVYDRFGNVILRTTRSGQVESTFYNERGLVCRHVNALGGEITYGWDERDRLTQIVDPHGGVYSLMYVGDSRRVAAVTDPRGGVTRMGWEGTRLREVRDPAGVGVLFSYNDAGDLVGVTDVLGNTTEYVRDDHGYLVAEISPRGGRKDYTFDGAGRLASFTNAVGDTWRYAWQGDALVEFVAPDGGATRLEYDQAGQLVSATDPLGHASHRSYDDVGNVVGIELPDGAKVAYSYDSLSRVTSMVDADGYRWAQGYSPDGMLSSLTDPLGGTISSSVDVAGRALHMVGSSPQGTITNYPVVDVDGLGQATTVHDHDGDDKAVVVYDECGNPIERLLSDGSLWRYEYDLAGKLLARIDPQGLRTEYEYDVRGKVARIDFPDGTWVGYSYNADGHLCRWDKSDGSFERFEFDLAGRVIATESSARGKTSYKWNKTGQVIYARDGWSGERRYSYDLAGNLVKVRNGLGGTTKFAYDERNRLIRTVFPDGQVETRVYNGRNRITKLDMNGQVTTGRYDGVGRLVSVTDPLGQTVTYDEKDGVITTRYDDTPGYSVRVSKDGRQRIITDHVTGVEHSMVYDRRGRLVEHSVDGHTTTRWAYTPSGRKASQVAPNGDVTEYHYDTAGRLSGIDHSALGHVEFVYDHAGQLAAMTTPHGYHEWAYHQGKVTSHTHTNAAGTTLTSIVRDSSQRITTINAGGGEVCYGYDAAGQLATITSPGGTTGLVFDTCGRLISEHGPGKERTYTYNAFGQLTQIRDGTAVVDYAYDDAGRRISEHDTIGTGITYTWDRRGYLARVEDTRTGASQHIVSDALGNPIQINTTTIEWDNTTPIARPIQHGSDCVLNLPGGMLFKDGEQVAWRPSHASELDDPWQSVARDGSAITPSGSVMVGHLELLGARVLDPRTRSFLSTDPLPPISDQPGSVNTYSYANNNPLAYVDPWGMRPATDADLDAYQANLPGSKWEYLAGGALVIGGVAATILMGPVAGAVAGGFLISAGVSTMTQKWSTGSVDPTQLLFDGAIGAVSGLAGGAAGGAVTKFAQSRMTSAFGARLFGYGADAAVSSAIDTTYTAVTTDGFTAKDFGRTYLTNTATGFAFSTVGGEIGHGLETARTKPDVSPDINAAHTMSATNDVPLAQAADIPQSTNPRSGEGIIYLRQYISGEMKPYVGHSKSPERFDLRQSEHMRAFPGKDFRYEILESGLPEDQLSRYEEFHIRDRGGPTNKGNPDGGLSNKRHEMSDRRYMEAGGSPYGQ